MAPLQVMRRPLNPIGQMSNIVRVPDFNNLFSEIGTFPSCGYRMGSRPMPNININDLALASLQRPQANVDPSGTLRYLFFNRPLVPFMQAVPVEVIMSPHLPGDDGPEPAAVPLTRTIATQSIYREEGSQTVPYSTDYVMTDPNNPPEIFHLKDWVPRDPRRISLTEVEQIERQQERRAFEANLPPMKTEQDFIRRSKLLQQREMEECQYREQQIIALEKLRLESLVSAIHQREAQRDAQTQSRLDAIMANNEMMKKKTLTKIHKRRYNAMRKINRERIQLKEDMFSKGDRDIIADYSHYGSEVYAPLDRNGSIPRQLTDQSVKKQISQLGTTYESIVALEMTIPSSSLNLTVKRPGKVMTELMKTRKGQAIIADVDKIDAIIKSAKLSTGTTLQSWNAVPTSQLYARPVGAIRPSTPVERLHKNPSEMDDAARLIQRVIRGRAVQIRMTNAIQDKIDLIRELLTAPSMMSTVVPVTVDMAHQYVMDAVIGSIITSACGTLRSAVIADEQIQEQRALLHRALKTRATREAEQAGRRQKMMISRGKLQEQIAKIDEIIHRSVLSIIDPILETTISQVSRERTIAKAKFSNSNVEPVVIMNDYETVMDCIEHEILPEVDIRLKEHQDGLSDATVVTAVHGAISTAFNAVNNKQ